MYGHPMYGHHLSMKQHIEHIERASPISRISIAKLNSVNTTLLIRLYKIFTRPYMATLIKLQRHKLEVIQNHCVRYVRRTDSAYISNSELRSRCNLLA